MWVHCKFSFQVEFLGGPADGLVVAVDYPPKPFLALERVPEPPRVSWRRRLWRYCRKRSRPPSHVSIYELRHHSEVICYHHVGTYAMSPNELAAHRDLIAWTDVGADPPRRLPAQLRR